MARTINSSTLASFQSDSSYILHLVSVDLTTTVIRYTSAPIDVTYNSNTYTASELFVNVGGVAQSSTLQNNQLGISISTAEGSFAQYMQTYNWHNGEVLYYLAACDSSSSIIGSPVLMFKGLLSTWSLSEQDGSELELTADSHWADFERIGGRRTNTNSQHQYDSADDGMDFAAEAVRDMKWGVA